MNRESDQVNLYLQRIKDKISNKDIEIAELNEHIRQLKHCSNIYITKINKLQKQLKKGFRSKKNKDQNQLDLFKDSLANKIDRSGEKNGRAKLDWETVKYLRETVLPSYKKLDRAGRAVYRKQYSSIYKVTSSCIYNILENRTWKEK